LEGKRGRDFLSNTSKEGEKSLQPAWREGDLLPFLCRVRKREGLILRPPGKGDSRRENLDYKGRPFPGEKVFPIRKKRETIGKEGKGKGPPPKGPRGRVFGEGKGSFRAGRKQKREESFSNFSPASEETHGQAFLPVKSESLFS